MNAVAFTIIALETGLGTLGWVSFVFSDGYTNTGPLTAEVYTTLVQSLKPASQPSPSFFLSCNTFSSLLRCTSKTFTVDHAEPRLPGFCRTCQEPTYREIRYRSDFQFVGRLLSARIAERQYSTSRIRDGVPRLLTSLQAMWLLDLRERPSETMGRQAG